MPLDPKTADLMLSDWEGWEKTLNDGQRQELEGMLRFEPDREAAKKRFAGVAYVAAATGADAEEVSRRFEDWYLPAFTIDETVGLGRKEPVKDAGQFFDLLKDRASNNRARLDALLSAQEAAFRSAIADGDDLADFAAWQATQDNEEAWQGKAREAWQTARRETLERLGPDGRGLAKRVVRSLRHEMGVAVEPDAWINQTREMLVDLKARDAEKYELVLAAAKEFNAKQQQPDKGVGQGVAESFGRGVADLVAGLPRALVDMSQDAAEAAARAGFTNAPDPEALADKIKAGRDVDIDLRDLARGVIDPVKSKREGWAKYAEESLYLAAGSLPYALVNPLPGGAVVVRGYFTSEAYNDLRQAGFTGAGAAAMALTSGFIKQKIESASEAFVRIPGVAQWMAKWGAKPGSSWLGQLLPRGAARLGVEYGEEFAQQITTPALQELGAALTDAVPDRPEGQKVRDVIGQFTDKETGIPLALSILPIAFIGAAASTGRDLAVIEAVMENPRYLRAVMSEEKARAVMEEPNTDKRAEMIREGWQATPTPVIVERVQAIQQEERKAAAEVLRTIQEAERAGMIPTIRRGAQGWTVEKDGVAVPVSTREEAVAMAYASLDEMERKAAEATAQLADEFMAAGGERAEAFEISRQGATVQSEVEAGRATPENASRAVELYGQMHGLTAEEASAESLAVLGNNRMEQVEGVRTAVSRIFGGGNVLTAIHEGVHGRWNAGLERGHYSHAMGVSWVRMAEQASGWQFLPTRDDAAVTPAMLDEAIVEVAQADLLGRRKDGKQHFTPGLISRGVASFALAGRAQAKEAGKLATFLKAWREFWGQVLRAGRAMAKARRQGKLGDDFDVLLDDLLGTEPQQRFEAQAAREAADMAAEINADNMPFSLAPSNLAQAEQHLRALAGKPMTTADGLTATVSGVTAAKMASASAVRKSASPAAHLAAIGAFEELYQRGRVVESSPDRADDPNITAIHRVESPMAFQGRVLAVKFTVKEFTRQGNRIYSIEAMDLASASPAGQSVHDAADTAARGTPITGDAQQENAQPGGESQAAFSLAPTDPDKFRAWFRESKVTDAQGKPLVVYHGAPDVRGLFSEGFKSYSRGSVFFAAADYRAADTYADDRRAFDYQNAEAGVIPLFLSIQNPMEIDAKGARWRETERFVQEAKDKGHDGIIIRNVLDDYNTTPATKPTTVYAFFSATQAKSALAEPMRSRVDRQPIAGALPNSGEFSPADPRLSFSLAPRSLASVADTVLAAQMRKPEFREKYLELARQRLDKLRQDGEWRVSKWGQASQRVGTDTLAGRIRTSSNIEAERKFRQRSRQRELIDEGMAKLTPETLAAYEQGLTTIEDDPLVSQMLDRGKLMSKTEAAKAGKLKTDGKGNAGDYDGAPWLPPSWYAGKGRGYMPDQMAQELHAAGLLKDAYPDTLWDALGRAIGSARAQNEAVRKAQAAVRAIEKNAAEQSRAEAEAWAKEERAKVPSAKDRQMAALRTLDVILSAFPPVVRGRVGGFVKLASLGSDAAREAEILRRLEKLDEVVEDEARKHYAERIDKLFERYRPQKDDRGRMASKLTPEAAEDVGFAYDFAEMGAAEQDKEIAAVEKVLNDSEDSAEIQDAVGRLGIMQLFSRLDEKDSAELEAAHQWLKDITTGAREARKVLDAARAEWVKAAKAQAKLDANNGKFSALADAENVEAIVESKTWKQFVSQIKGWVGDTLWHVGQQLELVFGQDSKITQEFHQRAVRAANQATDIKIDIERRRFAFVRELFGTDSRIKQAGRVGALQIKRNSGVFLRLDAKPFKIDVPADVVQRLLSGDVTAANMELRKDEVELLRAAYAEEQAKPANRRKRVFTVERPQAGRGVELVMSEDQGIQYLLWSRQKASREQMERDGWTEESLQQLDAFLSADAKAFARFFAEEYERLGRLLDPVYRRMFNAPFPRVRNYAPIYRDISSTNPVMDLEQQGMGSGLSSGFVMVRNKNANSALRRTSAITAFLQHAESAAHWVSHVELVRDLRAVLADKEVQNAIRASGRTAAADGIKKRIQQLESGGTIRAAGIASLDSWFSKVLQARAFKALAFKISPVIKQTSAFLNPLLGDVPAWEYLRGVARLMSGQLDVKAMWDSPDIQRRIMGGFSAEARIAMDKMGYSGSMLLAAMGKGMLPMQFTDAGWTTAGAAISFDYYRRMNMKAGMNETQATNEARRQLEMLIAETAQPADSVNRSLVEGMSNPWLKSMWMFASESRKTLAVEIMALRRLATGKSKSVGMDLQRAVVAHVIMAATTQLMSGVLALLAGDDDDREREWSAEEWAAAIIAGPINGLFVLGDAIEYTGRRLLGLHAFEPRTAIGQTVSELASSPKTLGDLIDGDAEEQRRALFKLGSAVGSAASITPLGVGNPFTAADVILGNPLKDVDKILTR